VRGRLPPRLEWASFYQVMKKKRSIRVILSLLVLNIWLGSGQVRAQLAEGQRVNYKLVPNLEPMKEKEPTPDFTLPRLSEENSSSNTSLWRRLWSWSTSPRSLENPVSLKDFRGKLVLLNFWATWCEPCREEMPAMEKLHQEFKDRGFIVLAVDIKDRQRDALAFVKELKLTYPVVFDPEGKTGLLYGAWGLPTTYLIGRTGLGLARLWGPANWYSPGARKLIQTLLEQKK